LGDRLRRGLARLEYLRPEFGRVLKRRLPKLERMAEEPTLLLTLRAIALTFFQLLRGRSLVQKSYLFVVLDAGLSTAESILRLLPRPGD
jgi:hypothetical protein